MTYDPNIPLGSQRPSQMYPQFDTNFNQLNQQYGTTGDHVEFTAASNNGKHKKSTYVEQPGDQTTAANEVAVYVKDNAGNPDIYFRRESNGVVLPLTDSTLVASSGSGFMANGMQIRCGSGMASAGAGTANAISPAFPTATLSVVANTKFGNNPIGIGATAANSFVASSTGSVNIFWIAIGY